MHTYDVTVNLYLQNEWPCRLLICFRSLMICDVASRWCQTMDLQQKHRRRIFFFFLRTSEVKHAAGNLFTALAIVQAGRIREHTVQ